MRARGIVEAESAKSFLKRIRAQVIPAGDSYYVAIAKPPMDLNKAEFCPYRLYQGNDCEQQDGMYGLLSDVQDVIVPARFRGPTPVDPTDAESDRVSEATWAYIEPITKAIKQGRSSGAVNGVAGPRVWQLVYWPRGKSLKRVPNNFSVQ